MGQHDDRRKQGSSSGISPDAAAGLSKQVHDAHAKALDNEKRIVELEKAINDKSQWNNTVRGWVGSRIEVSLLTNHAIVGVLKGLDRYTLLVFGHDFADAGQDDDCEIIIHKGAIATISQVK